MDKICRHPIQWMTNGALLPYLNGLELRERKIFDLARSFFLIDDVSIKDRAKPLPPLTLGLVYGRGVYLESPKFGGPR